MDVFSTIIGAVSLGFQVISLADSVIGSFDRIQNAPRELQDFRRAVVRLQRHFEFLQADVGRPLEFLSRDDVEAIQSTLEGCKNLLQQQVELQNGGMVNGVIRGVWTIINNQNLVRYKNEIDEHYSKVLVPTWLGSISARIANPHGPPLEKYYTPTIETASINSVPSIPRKQLNAIENRLKTLDDPQADIEQQLCTIDYELQTCWAELGLWDEKTIEHPSPALPRRSSLNFEHAPTTLILSSAPNPHKKIRLERLHIMARDDESRILQYQNHDATIHVTHIVPFGTIPWTETKKPNKVSFLTPHMITVIDKNGYHIYKIDPKYKFDDQNTCEMFQTTLRERIFCGAIEAVEVKMGSTIVSCRQMIRFWQRDESSTEQINTMTFLLTSVNTDRPGRHKEVDLSKFKQVAELRSSWRPGKRVERVVIKPIFQGYQPVCIRFETKQDALEFKMRYEAMRSGKQSLRPGSFSTASISVTRAPTEALHDWRSVTNMINNV